MSMLRWKLLLTTLPFVGVVLILVILRDAVLHIPALLDFGDIAPILTGAALLIGFMLSGVMADYKESERLPAQLVGALMALEDNYGAAAAAGKAPDLQAIRELHAAVTTTIMEWLMNRASIEACLGAINSLNAITGAFDHAGAGGYLSNMLAATQNLRGTVTRIQTIRRTSFIPAGYVLLDLLVVVTLALLIVAGFKNPIVQYLVVIFLALIYIYLIQLIHDLDNPFDYAPGGGQKGSAEIDSTPMLTYARDVQAALNLSRPSAAGLGKG